MAYDVFDPRTARERQQEGWAYVDVRTPDEFAAGHPEGAVNVPIMLFTAAGPQPNDRFVEAVLALFPPGSRLLMGCKSGGRSARACDALAAAGYTQLANVDGGYHGSPLTRGWLDEGLPTSTEGQTWDAVQTKL
jgi:rhodanese-related sulfurtransferase